jgi:hypothetical protein
MVSAFRAAGAIETTMVDERHMGSMFVINPGQPGSYDAFLVPFKAESWKHDLADFEMRKLSALKKITEIKPKYIAEAV